MSHPEDFEDDLKLRAPGLSDQIDVSTSLSAAWLYVRWW